MLHARPETLVLLGALLTGPLDLAGKHQLPPPHLQLQDVIQSPLGIREGRTAIKQFPEAGRSGQISEWLSWRETFQRSLHDVQVSPLGSVWGCPASRRNTDGDRRVPEVSQGV